jgi:hypothetical protein
MTGDRGNNYFIKFRYEEWLMLTCLLKPIQRDILLHIYCRKATCYKQNIKLNDFELEGLRKQFYRTMRKDTFYENLRPMIDQGLIIAQKDLKEGTVDYTTQMNETVMLDLAKQAEKKAKAEMTRLKNEQMRKQYGKSANPPVFLSNQLRDLNKRDIDED